LSDKAASDVVPDGVGALAHRGSTAAFLAWGISGMVTIVWLVLVLSLGYGERVLDNWRSALTMLGGSFLSGSSPAGGGAVAFPVFTKALHVPGAVARTFGLSIQSVGMTMAVVAILLHRRAIHIRSAIVGSVAAVIGFLVAVSVWGDSDQPFWPMSIGAAWVKATFSVVLATTSILMVRHLRRHGDPSLVVRGRLGWTTRVDAALIVVAFAGGVLSSLTGTGANIVVFLFLVVIIGVNPKVALPTTIIIMASVSVAGVVLLGIVDGQLDVELARDRVVAVGGQAFDGLARQTDLLGFWLAAVPVVVWGAPMGSFVAYRVPEAWLVRFVATLAAIEVASTMVLVDDLRSDPALIVYLAVGLVALPAAFIAVDRHRERVFGAPSG
jgi:uncharacterized membrane protein YfcA